MFTYTEDEKEFNRNNNIRLRDFKFNKYEFVYPNCEKEAHEYQHYKPVYEHSSLYIVH